MPKHPNILYLITDEQRADSLGEGGAPWASTPHLAAALASPPPTPPARSASAPAPLWSPAAPVPGERRNLSGDPAYAEIAQDLIARIDAWNRSRTITPPKSRKPTKL